MGLTLSYVHPYAVFVLLVDLHQLVLPVAEQEQLIKAAVVVDLRGQ